jgi:LPS sulfotransferase NodH
MVVASFLPGGMGWLPNVGAIVLIIVGFVSAVGYTRAQSMKIWRESAEGWKTENEANKERADRLATDLARTAAELRDRIHATDITSVLKVLQTQHKEATAVLTRIADESAERNGQIAKLLIEHSKDEQEAWMAALHIANETLKTVAALRSDDTGYSSSHG